jgi:hypothetical protein
MSYIKKLMMSRPLMLLIPDQSVVTVYSSGFVRSARSSDGTYAMAYISQGQKITVNTTKVLGTQVRVSWFNPRTGVYSVIGTFIPTAKTGGQTFTPPTTGVGQDWIIIVDNPASNYPVR